MTFGIVLVWSASVEPIPKQVATWGVTKAVKRSSTLTKRLLNEAPVGLPERTAVPESALLAPEITHAVQ